MPQTEAVVVDASALVDALLGTEPGMAVRARLRGVHLHAPAHLDAEVLWALGRLHRAGDVGASVVAAALNELAVAPIRRHLLADLLSGAWNLRERFRLVDALYVELAETLGRKALLTTDARLARECDLAELIGLARVRAARARAG